MNASRLVGSNMGEYAQPHFTRLAKQSQTIGLRRAKHPNCSYMANQDEERPLLGDQQENVQPTPTESCSIWKILASLTVLALLSVGGAIYFSAGASQQSPERDTARFSNGTHEFKRTVILISIDGLRQVLPCVYSSSYPYIIDSASYLDRGLTPHLLDISRQGLRAKYMKPVFPVSSCVVCSLLSLTRSARH